MCAAVVLGVFITIALLDSVHFRPRLSAIEGAAADAQAAYGTRTLSIFDVLMSHAIESREKTYSTPLAYWSFQKETQVVDGKEVRSNPRLAFGGSHLKDPEREWKADIAARSLRGRAARACSPASRLRSAAAALLGREHGGLRSSLSQIARGETEIPWRADADHGDRDGDDHRLAGGGLAVLPPVRHRSHRQRRAVSGAEKHSHRRRHRLAGDDRHAAAGDRARHPRRLLQGLGRRWHPVFLHRAVVDSADPAGGGVRAADQRVHRSERRQLSKPASSAPSSACSCCA